MKQKQRALVGSRGDEGTDQSSSLLIYRYKQHRRAVYIGNRYSTFVALLRTKIRLIMTLITIDQGQSFLEVSTKSKASPLAQV